MSATDQIKARLPLEEVVGETVVLKPAGQGRLKGLCPFHAEKTASFHVLTDKGFYYCFSCQAKGDLFSFVQETQGLEFRDALELLAERAGVTLPERSPGQKAAASLYEVNDLAARFFRQQLAAHPHAQDYVARRGFTPETITAWGLGYAPEGWHALRDHARTQGIGGDLLEAAGLARSKERRVYDLFRERIIIPIHDHLGRVVGFSGRALGEAQPKYLNTPETAIFHKGSMLFGLHAARPTIRESAAAILVEGQLDVVALHQEGFTAAVGAQSATLTEAQITALKRLGVTRLYLALDSDEAGQKATLAGCDAVARQFAVRVVRLPGKDPAETVQNDPAAFREALKRAVPETFYRFRRACAGVDVETAEGQRTVLQRLRSAMIGSSLIDPVAAELREVVARRLEVTERQLNAWLGDTHAPTPRSTGAVRQAVTDARAALRANIVALVLTHPNEVRASCEAILGRVSSDDPLNEFLRLAQSHGYDGGAVIAHLVTRAEYADVLGHITRGVDLPVTHLARLLGRYARQVPREVGAERSSEAAPLPTGPRWPSAAELPYATGTNHNVSLSRAFIYAAKHGAQFTSATAQGLRERALNNYVEAMPIGQRAAVNRLFRDRLAGNSHRRVNDAATDEIFIDGLAFVGATRELASTGNANLDAWLVAARTEIARVLETRPVLRAARRAGAGALGEALRD